MSDPSLLVTNPSRTDPSVAPAGRHTYYVLAPVPNLDRAPLRLARRPGRRYADELVAHAGGARLRRLRRRRRGAAVRSPPPTGRSRAWPPAPRSPPRTRLFQTGPFRPSNLHRDTVQRGLRRLRHPARRGRADGAHLRQARRRPDHRERPREPRGGAPGRAGRRRRARARRGHRGRRPPAARPAAPGLLGAAASTRTAGCCCSGGPRPRPGSRCAGPTPAAGTRCRASRWSRPPTAGCARSWASTRSPLTEVGVYVYYAEDPATGRVEFEYDHVLRGRRAGRPPPLPDPAEVAELRWVDPARAGGRPRRRPPRVRAVAGRGGEPAAAPPPVRPAAPPAGPAIPSGAPADDASERSGGR